MKILMSEVFKKSGKPVNEGPEDMKNAQKMDTVNALSPAAVSTVKEFAKSFASISQGILNHKYKDDQDLLMDIYSMSEKVAALQEQLSDAIQAGKKLTSFRDPMEG